MDDDICQDDKWFEQAFTYMNKHEIPLPNDKKLHVKKKKKPTLIIKNKLLKSLNSFMAFSNKQLLETVTKISQDCLIL